MFPVGKSTADQDELKKKTLADEKRKPVVGPRILQPLSSERVFAGCNVDLSCVFTGSPKPSVKWFHNNQEINQNTLSIDQACVVVEQTTDGDISSEEPDVFKATLTLFKASSDFIGIYKFTAANENGSATTSSNLVVVEDIPHSPGLMSLYQHFILFLFHFISLGIK